MSISGFLGEHLRDSFVFGPFHIWEVFGPHERLMKHKNFRNSVDPLIAKIFDNFFSFVKICEMSLSKVQFRGESFSSRSEMNLYR